MESTKDNVYVCIDRVRDKNGRIVEYILENLDDDTLRLKPDELKDAIRTNKLRVPNLTLTTNGRLIDNGALAKAHQKLEGKPKSEKDRKAERLENTRQLKRAFNSYGDDNDEPCSGIVVEVKRYTKRLFEHMGVIENFKIATRKIGEHTDILGAQFKNVETVYFRTPASKGIVVYVCVLYLENRGELLIIIRDKDSAEMDKNTKPIVDLHLHCNTIEDADKALRVLAEQLKGKLKLVKKHSIKM